MTDQKDDLVAEARVALAIKQAAEECTKIKDAAYGDGDITFNDLYWNGWDVSAGICSESILALPHDPEALEALLRQARNEALEKAADEIDIYRLLKKSGARKRSDIAKIISAAIRAVKGEGHD